MFTSTWPRLWWRIRPLVRATANAGRRSPAPKHSSTEVGRQYPQRFGDSYRWPDGTWTSSG